MKRILLSIVLAAGLCTLTKAQSLNIDGADDYVSTTINCDNTVMPDVTWEAWVKPTNPGNTNWQMIFATEDGNWDRFLAIQNGYFSMGIGSGPFQPVMADFNQWQHIAVVYTGDQVIFYKNGVQYIYGGVVDTATQNSMAAPLLFGQASYGLPYGGNIDEARIWNVALTQAQIQANMANCAFSAPQAGLVAWYAFNQGIPNGNNAGIVTLTDGSGNSNDGTLNNFALSGTTSNWVDDVYSTTVSISITASATSVYANTTITFNSLASGGALTYQWMINGVNVPGATASTYTTNTLSDSDTVSCMIESDMPCISDTIAYSNEIVVTIIPLPPPGAEPEILHYRFDGAGTAVVNYATGVTAVTDTATIMGALTQGSNGFCGGALIGSGNTSATDYLDTHYALDFGSGSWTVSMWTSNVQGTSTLYYVFGDPGSSSFRCFTNGVAGPNNWVLRGAGITDVYVSGGATVTPHITTFVYDNVANYIYAYLDGVLVSSVPNGPLNLTDSGPLKVIGYGSSNVGMSAGGLVDEFRMYRRALSASEVMALNDPRIRRTDNVTACDTLMSYNGTQTWTTSGTYTDTIPSVVSCDTIVTVNLTINNSSSNTINPTVCVSYTAPDGMVYTSSGMQTAVIPNAAGCDSTITINLTVNPLPAVSINYPGASPMECEGSLDTLTVSGAATYTWSTGSTSDTTIITHVVGTTTWTVLGTDSLGCSNSDTVSVTSISPAIIVTVDLSATDTTCVNYSAFPLATASPSGGVWSGTGVSGSDFDPVAAGIGMHMITYTVGSSCLYSATDSIYVSGCVGIKELNGNTTIALYPNPNNGSFVIKSEAEETCYIHNELGQVLITAELNATNNYEFNGKDLETGVYFVTGKNNSFRMKMVVTK